MGLFGKKPSEIEKNLERYYAEQEKKAETVIMYCPKCGGEVEEDDIYCCSCGADTDKFPPVNEKPDIPKNKTEKKHRSTLYIPFQLSIEEQIEVAGKRTNKDKLENIWDLYLRAYSTLCKCVTRESITILTPVEFEFIPYLYVLTELCLLAKGYTDIELSAIMGSLDRHISDSFGASWNLSLSEKIKLGHEKKRISLYRSLIVQRNVKGVWLINDKYNLSEKINQSIAEYDLYRLLVSFGDILYSEDIYEPDSEDKKFTKFRLENVEKYVTEEILPIQNEYIRLIFEIIK